MPLTAMLSEAVDQHFLEDVWAGLSASPKTLPCKYFYDDRGSVLFEKICGTDEYYVTRTEMAIFERCATDMARHIGEGAHIIEPGAGALKKISLLLAALDRPASYIPVDISTEFLRRACGSLQRRFPDLDIAPCGLDFNDGEAFRQCLDGVGGDEGRRVIFFPGSTIGNFSPSAAQHFLSTMAAALRVGDGLLIGVDLLKSVDILESAYNDAEGYTAAFNLNLLNRINEELDGELDAGQFSHLARFNADAGRIEMHLRSKVAQRGRIAGREFRFRQGETIHTENSYKYRVDDFQALAARSGFIAEALWTDDERLFSVHYMRRG